MCIAPEKMTVAWSVSPTTMTTISSTTAWEKTAGLRKNRQLGRITRIVDLKMRYIGIHYVYIPNAYTKIFQNSQLCLNEMMIDSMIWPRLLCFTDI
jgi:hypothetical protein